VREFLLALLRLLHDHQIRYAIGGSIASSYYGEPRTTQDIDLSIQLDNAGAASLIAACQELGWYISPEETARAAQVGGSFSLNDGFWKADIFVVRGDPFAEEAFRRRREVMPFLGGKPAWLLAPEDVIVHKLRWSGGKPVDKHVRDIAAIVHAQGDRLDQAYITRWAAALGTGGLWAAILVEQGRAGE
jgi:hypothetical protein